MLYIPTVHGIEFVREGFFGSRAADFSGTVTIAQSLWMLARAEGLEAHAQSVLRRLAGVA